jgi:sugar lactone lactonase YvrE
MRLLSYLAALCLLCNLAAAEDKPAPLPVKWEVKDLDHPESAYFDADTKTIFVSVIVGDGDKKDGKGSIAKLSLDGKLIKADWVEGLNAPKGLRAAKGKLWVADIDTIVGVEIATGKVTDKIQVPEAKFLNDLATSSDGTVYVTDMFASKIYTLKDGKPVVLAEGPELENPNGILVDGDALILGGWGTVGDATPKKLGHLLKLDLKTKKVTQLTKEPVGNLDGIEKDGKGGYIVTDWVAGKVFRIGGDGKVTLLMQHDKNGTADHAYLPDQKLLILPLMMDNKVVALEVK